MHIKYTVTSSLLANARYNYIGTENRLIKLMSRSIIDNKYRQLNFKCIHTNKNKFDLAFYFVKVRILHQCSLDEIYKQHQN